jgi:hypothetical protein
MAAFQYLFAFSISNPHIDVSGIVRAGRAG